MGGLFGGGSKESTGKHYQVLNAPVDTSGSSIPGDDKMAARMDLAAKTTAKKADQTLLGRSAPAQAAPAATPSTQPQVGYR